MNSLLKFQSFEKKLFKMFVKPRTVSGDDIKHTITSMLPIKGKQFKMVATNINSLEFSMYQKTCNELVKNEDATFAEISDGQEFS